VVVQWGGEEKEDETVDGVEDYMRTVCMSPLQLPAQSCDGIRNDRSGHTVDYTTFFHKDPTLKYILDRKLNVILFRKLKKTKLQVSPVGMCAY
jgi:hypothetical protein